MSTHSASLLFISTGAFVFSFILWKKLKEDYSNESIFSLGWILLLSGALGFWVASFLPGLDFWISILPPALLGAWAAKKMGFKLFELTDALTPAFVALLFFSSFSGLLSSQSIISPSSLALVITAVSASVYIFSLKKYRSFSWYPSGRVGFPGLASLAVYFTFRSVAMYLIFVLPFFGEQGQDILKIADVTVSLTLSLLLWIILYLRSGRNLANRLSKACSIGISKACSIGINIWQK